MGRARSIRTAVVHAGRGDLRELGLHAPPIDRSSTYPLSDLRRATADLEAMAQGEHPTESPVYGRLHNPTVARFEQGVAELEGAEDAVAFGSGMAAITATLLAAGASEGHVAALRPLYGGTDHLLSSGLLGSRVTWTTPEKVAVDVGPDTALVLVETPSNPLLDLVDIAALVADAGDVPVLVDNTFATPILQQPLRHGAAWALHSATKFLGGHGDVLAGVVACDGERAAALRRVRVATGALLDPDAAALLHRSLPTLALRVQAAQEGATDLAARLAAHPAVTWVRHPSRPGADPQGLMGRQQAGPGAVLAFEVDGGHDAAAAVMAAVRLITPAVSLGATDTLIEHPAGLTHRVVAAEALTESGVTPGTLRLSVGIEDPADLWEDLAAALDAATQRR